MKIVIAISAKTTLHVSSHMRTLLHNFKGRPLELNLLGNKTNSSGGSVIPTYENMGNRQAKISYTQELRERETERDGGTYCSK